MTDASSKRLAKRLLEKYQKDLFQPEVESLVTEIEERLKTAIQESNRMTDESKKISELKDRLLLEKTQLQCEKRLLIIEKSRMLFQFDVNWRKAADVKGLLESKLSEYDQMSFDLLMVETDNEKLRNQITQLQTERDVAKIEKNMLKTSCEEIESKLVASQQTCMESKDIIERMEVQKLKQDEANDKLIEDLKKITEEKDALLCQNESLKKKLMRTEFDGILHKASEESSQLELKLQAASESHVLQLKSIDQMKDELLMVNAHSEKLENEKKISDEAKDKLSENFQTVLEQKNLLLVESEKFRSETNRIWSNFDLKLHKASEKNIKLESKLKSTTEYLRSHCQTLDELLKVKENFEKLQNEKKHLGEENEKLAEHLKMVSKERDSLVTEKERLLTQTEIEKRHMRVEFQDKCHAVFREVNQLKSRSIGDVERMKSKINNIKNDLLVFKAYFEKL